MRNGKGELVKPSQSAVANKEEIPEWLQDVKGQAGLEAMDQGDLVLPRLAIAQTLSPALNKSKPKYIEGLEVGMLYNTVTRRIYGPNVRVVPILFSKMRIKFKPISEGGGIVCQSLNGIDGGILHPSDCATCEHSQFKADGTKPTCYKFMNYASILPDEDKDLLAVSMKSTAVAIAKQWNSLMRMTGKPAFAKSYVISTVMETRNGNDFYNYKVEPSAGWVPKDIFDFGTELHENLKAQGIRVDVEDEELNDADNFDTENM
jgi:hypothetical protein